MMAMQEGNKRRDGAGAYCASGGSAHSTPEPDMPPLPEHEPVPPEVPQVDPDPSEVPVIDPVPVRDPVPHQVPVRV